VQSKIDEHKAKGRDVTEWQKNLDDAKMLVANDMNTLANVLKKVSALQPSDYGTTSKTVIEQANADIKAVMKDFNTIRKNLNASSYKKSNLAKERDDDGDIRKGGTKKHNDLSGSSWTWVSSTQNGTTTSAPSGGKFVLTFGKDKRLSSTTDCNGVGGEYEVEKNNTLSFSKFMSTLMFCEGSMEQTYTSQLMKTSSYSLSSSTLLLTGSSGTMTFTKK
jgi:heat shock protein HslJ